MSLNAEQLQIVMEAALTAVQQQATANNTQATRSRLKGPERPDVDLGFSETQWEFFKDEWGQYKRRAVLRADQINDELRACCSKELRKTLFDFVGGTVLSTLTEAELLEKIKATAVIGKNKAVHRKEFYELFQVPEEPINRYVAKLKAKSECCNFTITCAAPDCTHVNNYSMEMIKDHMKTGLYDKDIQQEILAKDKDLKTFEDVYAMIEAYELGKRAKTELESHPSSDINAMKSQYKLNKDGGALPKKSLKACNGCGSTSHSGQQREEKCIAWGKKCYKCGKKNHLKEFCKSDPAASGRGDQDQSEASEINTILNTEINTILDGNHPDDDVSFSFFYAFNNVPRDSSPTDRPRLPVPHVEWDGEKFVKATPAPLPAINVHVTLLRSFHEAYLKTSITCNQSAVVLRAFTDTCAQTCVSGVNMLHALNLSQDMVIPTSHQILGVTKRKLNIVGIVLVTVKFNATEWKTPVYISKDVNGFFLSETVQQEV